MKRTLWTVATLIVALSAALSTAAEPKRHPLAHVVHITASLTFDGKPVRIDDLIDCYASYTGTPTSSPHMVFKPNRDRITRELPGGGMITFRVSRELCYVNGDQWGSALPSYSAPAEWTPVLEWYDDRDVLKRSKGIWYMSEYSLLTPSGRLKIIEPFVVSTPEHPPSEALLYNVERQKNKFDYYQSRQLTATEKYKINSKPLAWMFRMTEREWRNPKAARPGYKFKRTPVGNDEPDYKALADFLDLQSGDNLMYLGYPSDFGDDIRSILHGLKRGRSRGLNSPFTYGLPIIEADRFGLLLVPRIAENMTSLYSYFPSRFDNFVSFTCDDGIAMASIKNTGIRHWSNDNCLINNQHRDHSVFGLKFRSLPVFTHDNLFFNPKNGDLWRIDGGF